MPVMMETCYKGRDSAGSSRLRDSSPPSRRSPRHVNSNDKGHYKDSKDSRGLHDSGMDNCRDRNSSSSSSSAAKNTEKHRAEVLKTALRACADWTEHLSSSGKIYYYNCKTEVSRWDKPKEWGTEASVVVLNNSKPSQKPVEKSGNSSSKKNDGRHSTNDDHGDLRSRDNKGGYGSSSASRNSYSGAKSTPSNCVPPSSSSLHYNRTNSSASSNDNFSRHRDSGSDRLSDTPRRYESSRARDGSSPRTYRADITSSSSRGERLPPVSDRDSRREGSATPGTPHADRNSVNLSNSRSLADFYDRTPGGSSLKRKHEEPAEDMDMDISPDGTPTEEAALRGSSGSTIIVTANGTHASPASLVSHHPLPAGIGMVPPPSSAATGQALNRQLITQQTIETLQQFLDIQQKRQAHQLQEKMQSVQRQQQQKELLHQLNKGLDETESVPSPPSPTESEGTPLDSPVDQSLAPSRLDSERKSSASEVNQQQPISIRGVKVVSALANQLGGRRHDPVQLTPTLINYYNDKLIGHTLGWITDGAEKQIQRVGEESHVISSRHCSRIGVELKRSRSLVRIAEIQANIKEQRVLFLQQHLKDLESGRSNLIAPDGT